MTKKFRKPKHRKESQISKAKAAIRTDFDPLISFSFKYYQVGTDKFDPVQAKQGYTTILINRLRELSRMKIQEFYSSRSRSLPSHPIDWNDTSEKSFGIPEEEKIVSVPYQFELSVNEHGRVHGFIIGSVFYIRWLDPKHNLYS